MAGTCTIVNTHKLVDGYAFAKLEELIFELLTDLSPKRESLSNNLHYLVIISASDFRLPKHQEQWKELQVKLVGKTRNIGLERDPIERLTVRNDTIERSLIRLWEIYQECKEAQDA